MRRRHGMNIAVTARTGRQLEAGGALWILAAVCTGGLLLDDVPVTRPAVHRIEAAPVPAALRARVAIEATHLAVRTTLEQRRIDLVAIVTGILVLGLGRDG